jgi:hypothetical protein
VVEQALTFLLELEAQELQTQVAVQAADQETALVVQVVQVL